ncbi:SCO4225 family membrane protein [Actinoplanes xinjiangensis]|uniref:SCO4225 family membrane protein n=1 Tax=Actinoplanes xinjiangensis TaxID=512350 RepID=UPI0034279269
MRIARWFVGSWVSRIYLAVVAAVTTYVVASASIQTTQSGYTDSMPEIVLLPLSMPGVLLTLPMIMTTQGPWWLSLVVCVAIGALINAAAINVVASVLRRSRTRRTEAHSPAAEAIG